MTTRSQEKIVKILLLLTEIVKPKYEQPDEQSDAANMYELESEKSAEQRRKILKTQNKKIALDNLSIYCTCKTLNQHTATINLRFLHQLGMRLLICLMVLILLQIFKIILNLSSKNMKL